MNVFISDLRDVIVWSLHGGEELIKPTRMRWNFQFDERGVGRGINKCFFFVLFSNQINSLQKIYIAIHKCTAFYECLVALIVCSRDYTACSSTQHPPHLQTSRCHPLRKTEQQPLYLSSQSNVPVRRDRQTDSDQTDFVSPIWPRHASDFAQD